MTAAARVPGPQVEWQPIDLDDGTSCRHLSPSPGPVGIDKRAAAFSLKPATSSAYGGITSSSSSPGVLTTNQPQRVASPIRLTFYGRHESLTVIASLRANVSDDIRQKAIDILIKEHAIDLSTTKSMFYDKSLTKEGQNRNGHIRIGPKAYSRSTSWLAHIIFHETVHSDQFSFYSSVGIDLTALEANENNSELLRLLYALDEVESWFILWTNRLNLGMSTQEIADIEREYHLFSIDLDDTSIRRLADEKRFLEARMMLISRLR
jgi:hypothetical protein